MLLEFKTSNYKSFVEEMTFSLIPAPKQTGLDFSVMEEVVGNKKIRGLSSAVIYGPNASGKTNVIGALDSFSDIISRGNINNTEQSRTPDYALTNLELIPNCNLKGKPTTFSIKFIDKDLLFAYSLKCDLGPFLDRDYKRVIQEESFSVNEHQVFLRKGKEIDVKITQAVKEYAGTVIVRKTEKTMEIAKNSLNDTELFLTNGFKSIFSKELVSRFIDWFNNRLVVIYRADAIRSLVVESLIPKDKPFVVEQFNNAAAKAFGINSNAIGYKRNPQSGDIDLYSVVSEGNTLIPSEMFESYGTIRFMHEFPLILTALTTGGTLVIDEFDASIHPVALMNIINIFHNDDLNRKHAQLVFNTHNPIFLDSSLFRRDEIKFVEMNEEKKSSELYSLSDFRTADGIRKGEDYMHNYFIDRYGAIKDVDFSPIVEKLMKEEVGDNNG